MNEKKMILCTCTDCGLQFESKGHRTVCDACKVEHQRENSRRWRERAKAEGKIITGKPHYKYTCQVCGTKTNDTNEVCHSCKEKWELWGIIINMVKREKEKVNGNRRQAGTSSL